MDAYLFGGDAQMRCNYSVVDDFKTEIEYLFLSFTEFAHSNEPTLKCLSRMENMLGSQYLTFIVRSNMLFLLG